ncbi:MAG: ABC transporter permease [Deinococcales bacterium]
MISYFIRRLFHMIFVLWGVSFAAFFLANVVPADPAAAALGSNARQEQVEAFREKNGLNKPIWEQYGNYMSRLLKGDLGRSLRTKRSISSDLKEFFPATLELTLAALLVSLCLGIPLGIIAALYHDKALDVMVRSLALIGGATPIYWLALVLLNLLHAKLGWLPGPGRIDPFLFPPDRVTGFMSLDALIAKDWEVFWDALRHLILPAFVLGGYSTALVTRMTRSAMLDVMRQDFVRTARSKGLREQKVIIKHTLRNASLPILTVAGNVLGSLLAGAVLTETIFSWPGIGSYATSSAISLDFPAVMGVTFVAGLSYSLINLLTDLLYAFFDPRISYR